MARIRILSRVPQVVETTPVVSILNSLTREGVKLRHDCGGKTLCGTCRVRIVSGASSLSPIGERERVRLTAVGASEDERLACQTYAFRDVEIEIPEYDDV
ncbi:MAG: 2Fe-2S iron-sulfur cluster-binding protein [Treponemataceae bacterium]